MQKSMRLFAVLSLLGLTASPALADRPTIGYFDRLQTDAANWKPLGRPRNRRRDESRLRSDRIPPSRPA
jgi:hypothetical protein